MARNETIETPPTTDGTTTLTLRVSPSKTELPMNLPRTPSFPVLRCLFTLHLQLHLLVFPQATVAALLAQEKGAGGQHIEVSMLETAFSFCWPDLFANFFWTSPREAVAPDAGLEPLEASPTPPPPETSVLPASDPFRRHLQPPAAHLLFGPFHSAHFPVAFCRTPLRPLAPAPFVGEHTRRVLREGAGMGDKEVQGLLAEGSCVSSRSLLLKMKKRGPAKVFGLIERLQGGAAGWAPARAPPAERGPEAGQGGPMKGVRVLDFSHGIAGPMAACILGDQGAEVTKIEVEGVLDGSRQLGAEAACDGVPRSTYVALNRNKAIVQLPGSGAAPTQSVIQTQLLELGVAADVLLCDDGAVPLSFTAALAAAKPELILVHIRRCSEPHAQSISGMAHEQRQEGQPHVRMFVAEKVTALYTALSISAALLARQRGEGGQVLQVDMERAAVHFAMPDLMWPHLWKRPKETPRFPALRQLYRVFPFKDGRFGFVGGLPCGV